MRLCDVQASWEVGRNDNKKELEKQRSPNGLHLEDATPNPPVDMSDIFLVETHEKVYEIYKQGETVATRRQEANACALLGVCVCLFVFPVC